MADTGGEDVACRLKSHLIANAPGTVYYIPDFISEEEEEYLTRQVNAAPKPKWTQLLNRRLQNWGGLPHKKGMVPETMPEWLGRYCKKITDLGAFEGKEANHVLVNEYKPGQGIMPHLDGDLYYPTVSTITLGSHTLLDFYRPLDERGEGVLSMDSAPATDANAEVPTTDFSQRHVTSILLERRSLVLIKDDMFNVYLHGIENRTSDTLSNVANIEMCKPQSGQTLERGTRISLTIRHVPKVLKMKFKFGRR